MRSPRRYFLLARWRANLQSDPFTTRLSGVTAMANIIITIVMLALLGICLAMGVIILMQKPSANAGMGAALGAGAAESVFGGEAGNMLLKLTVRISVAFFVVSFLLYLGVLAHSRNKTTTGLTLPAATVGAADTTSANTTTTVSMPASNPVTSGKVAPTSTSGSAAVSAASAASSAGAGTTASSGLQPLAPAASSSK